MWSLKQNLIFLWRIFLSAFSCVKFILHKAKNKEDGLNTSFQKSNPLFCMSFCIAVFFEIGHTLVTIHQEL